MIIIRMDFSVDGMWRTWQDWASDRLASARRAWWLTCSQIVEGSRTWTRTARQPLSHNCCCMSSRIERSHSMREASSWASTFPLLAICRRGWRELVMSSSDISPAEGIGEASKKELKFRISMSVFIMWDFSSAKTVRKAAPSPWRGKISRWSQTAEFLSVWLARITYRESISLDDVGWSVGINANL